MYLQSIHREKDCFCYKKQAIPSSANAGKGIFTNLSYICCLKLLGHKQLRCSTMSEDRATIKRSVD